jgi:hypothetical protein
MFCREAISAKNASAKAISHCTLGRLLCHSIQYPDFGCQMPSELQMQRIAGQHGGVLLFCCRVKFSHVRESIIRICLMAHFTVAPLAHKG